MTVIPLGRLFVSGRDPGVTMAMRGELKLRFEHFAADVAHTVAAVRANGATRGGVISTDPYRFLVGLFGLMQLYARWAAKA